MKSAIRSAAPMVIFVLAITGGVAVSGISVGNTGAFPLMALLASGLLALVAGVQHWNSLPWLPWVALVVASVGYMANNVIWMNIAFFIFGIMTIWHSHKMERRRPPELATA